MVLINKAPVSSGKLFIFATGPSPNIKRIISVDKTMSVGQDMLHQVSPGGDRWCNFTEVSWFLAKKHVMAV